MTRQHSYDEYSLGNGYAYSNVYRYIFRNNLHYSLSICIRIGYIWKNHIIFPVFKFFFSLFEKSRSFHPRLRCGDRRIDRLLRLIRKKTFMRLHSLMKWNFFKRENPDCLQIYGDWQASWTWYRPFCCSVASFIVVVIGFCCTIKHKTYCMQYVLCFMF